MSDTKLNEVNQREFNGYILCQYIESHGLDTI